MKYLIVTLMIPFTINNDESALFLSPVRLSLSAVSAGHGSTHNAALPAAAVFRYTRYFYYIKSRRRVGSA